MAYQEIIMMAADYLGLNNFRNVKKVFILEHSFNILIALRKLYSLEFSYLIIIVL